MLAQFTPSDVHALLASIKALIIYMLILQVIDIVATIFQIVAKIVIFGRVIRLLEKIDARDTRFTGLLDIMETHAKLTDKTATRMDAAMTTLTQTAPVVPTMATEVAAAKRVAEDTNAKVTEIQKIVKNGNGNGH